MEKFKCGCGSEEFFQESTYRARETVYAEQTEYETIIVKSIKTEVREDQTETMNELVCCKCQERYEISMEEDKYVIKKSSDII